MTLGEFLQEIRLNTLPHEPLTREQLDPLTTEEIRKAMRARRIALPPWWDNTRPLPDADRPKLITYFLQQQDAGLKPLSLRQLAGRTGLNVSLHSRAENNHHISFETLVQTLAALGVPARDPRFMEAVSLWLADNDYLAASATDLSRALSEVREKNTSELANTFLRLAPELERMTAKERENLIKLVQDTRLRKMIPHLVE